MTCLKSSFAKFVVTPLGWALATAVCLPVFIGPADAEAPASGQDIRIYTSENAEEGRRASNEAPKEEVNLKWSDRLGALSSGAKVHFNYDVAVQTGEPRKGVSYKLERYSVKALKGPCDPASLSYGDKQRDFSDDKFQNLDLFGEFADFPREKKYKSLFLSRDCEIKRIGAPLQPSKPYAVVEIECPMTAAADNAPPMKLEETVWRYDSAVCPEKWDRPEKWEHREINCGYKENIYNPIDYAAASVYCSFAAGYFLDGPFTAIGSRNDFIVLKKRNDLKSFKTGAGEADSLSFLKIFPKPYDRDKTIFQMSVDREMFFPWGESEPSLFDGGSPFEGDVN